MLQDVASKTNILDIELAVSDGDSLRHDTVGRECYIPGVLTAIRGVVQYQGLVTGLDKLLGL